MRHLNILLLHIFLIIVFISCNSSTSSSNNTNNAAPKEPIVNNSDNVSETKKIVIAETPPEFLKGKDLLQKQDCLGCHHITQKLVGPTYAEVALRYTQDDKQTITQLAKTIIKGSKGKWGDAIMTPHPALSQKDAEDIVAYILSLQ